MNPIYLFFSGATMMAALVCALFFLRFWRKTGDRLFCIFSIAFALMGVERLLLLVYVPVQTTETEDSAFLYLVRLCSFLMLIYAIWDKNRPARDK